MGREKRCAVYAISCYVLSLGEWLNHWRHINNNKIHIYIKTGPNSGLAASNNFLVLSIADPIYFYGCLSVPSVLVYVRRDRTGYIIHVSVTRPNPRWDVSVTRESKET